MQGLIDTHFHLDMYRNYAELYKYIDQEKQYTLCVTNSPGVFLSCKRMFGESKYIKFALGFHPLEGGLKKKDLDDFMYLLPQTEYVGEIGLDFTRKTVMPRDKQLEFFDRIVEACAKNNKIMSVHIRGAEKEVLQIIDRWRPRRCILHWFTGSLQEQQEFIDLDCYFSINAGMLSNSERIRLIPREKILVESDGPYSKIDGKKYQPSYLLREYELIAKALKEPDLIKLVYSNFKTLLTL